MNQIGISMPSRTAPLRKIPEYAQLADEAGFDSVWSYELTRTRSRCCVRQRWCTEHATLGTGLAAAFLPQPV